MPVMSLVQVDYSMSQINENAPGTEKTLARSTNSFWHPPTFDSATKASEWLSHDLNDPMLLNPQPQPPTGDHTHLSLLTSDLSSSSSTYTYTSWPQSSLSSLSPTSEYSQHSPTQHICHPYTHEGKAIHSPASARRPSLPRREAASILPTPAPFTNALISPTASLETPLSTPGEVGKAHELTITKPSKASVRTFGCKKRRTGATSVEDDDALVGWLDDLTVSGADQSLEHKGDMRLQRQKICADGVYEVRNIAEQVIYAQTIYETVDDVEMGAIQEAAITRETCV